MLKIGRSKVVDALVALGLNAITAKMTNERLLAKVERLPDIIKGIPKEKLPKGEERETLKLLVKAAAEKDEVRLVDDDIDDPDGEDEDADDSAADSDVEDADDEDQDESEDGEEGDEPEDDDTEGEDEDVDDEEVPAKKPAKTKKAASKGDKSGSGEKKGSGKPANFAKKGGDGKPGVIASIVEFLDKATAERPITKRQILAKLVARFPENDESGMMKTINAQVPRRLQVQKGLNVVKTEKGFFVDKAPEGKFKKKAKASA